jgi:hypothetical protein
MTDNLQDRGGADRKRINMSETWEIDYWTGKFGVSREELEKAVERAGPMVDDVAKELGKAN